MARTVGILKNVASPVARRAVVASGLPLSVAWAAFNQLGFFREIADRFLDADKSTKTPLFEIIKEIEVWARVNAVNIGEIPSQDLLDHIRPLWIAGTPLYTLVERCGEKSVKVCTHFYGYQLPWLFHAIAQKLDKEAEPHRIEIFASVGLLIELGLPSENAAKVFLAGVRSRAASIEFGKFITNSSISVSQIRDALLDRDLIKEISASLSPSTLQWLRMLSEEHQVSETEILYCEPFQIDAPKEVNILHVRGSGIHGGIYLCSDDMSFKSPVTSTQVFPFDKFANDPRYIFFRDKNVWRQRCRDPRTPSIQW